MGAVTQRHSRERQHLQTAAQKVGKMQSAHHLLRPQDEMQVTGGSYRASPVLQAAMCALKATMTMTMIMTRPALHQSWRTVRLSSSCSLWRIAKAKS